MNIKILSAKLVLCLVISLALPAVHAGSFDKGNLSVTASVGSAQLFRENYSIIGAGVGYYVSDGIELGVDVDYWTGGDPSIYELTPKLTYVFDNSSQVKPYLGVFYNRTYIDGFDDTDAMGYRLGAFMPMGKEIYIGLGVVHTELQDCTDSILVTCSETYTELIFMISI